MNIPKPGLVVISHAGIKQINREIYRLLLPHFPSIALLVPASLRLSSGKVIAAEPEPHPGLRVIPLELSGQNPRLYYYPGLLQWLDDLSPDVVILENDPASRLGWLCARWCGKHQRKLFCQSYDNFGRDPKSSFKRLGLIGALKNLPVWLMNGYMTGRTAAVLVINRESLRLFRSYGFARVVQIPLGFDQTIFYRDAARRQHTRSQLGIGSDALVVAYFGRMVRQKGVHLLVQALIRLKHLEWVLLLDHAHDHSDAYGEEIMNLLSTSNLTDRVRLFEASHHEIADYMRAADIAVSPSLSTPTFVEQYGRTVQEAMACGCLTLVSDSGHLPDLVSDTRLVFPQGRLDSLLDLLHYWITHPSERLTKIDELAQRANASLSVDAQLTLLKATVGDHWRVKQD